MHCLDIHAHARDPERMLLSLQILLDYLSFPLKYGLSFGTQPGDNAAELLSPAALEYNTI